MLFTSVCSGLKLQIAKAEKLKPLEVELKKLEDLAESIVNDFAYMRAREEEMRDTNGMFIGCSLFELHTDIAFDCLETLTKLPWKPCRVNYTECVLTK